MTEESSITELSQLRLSPEAQDQIKGLNVMHGQALKRIKLLIETLRTVDKLPDPIIKEILLKQVHFVSRATLYRALPEEIKRHYTRIQSSQEEEEEEADQNQPETYTEQEDESEFDKQLNEDVPTFKIASFKNVAVVGIEDFLISNCQGVQSFEEISVKYEVEKNNEI